MYIYIYFFFIFIFLLIFSRKSLSIEALSKFEDIDLFGYHDSGASGSSGDSGADDLPYRGWTNREFFHF